MRGVLIDGARLGFRDDLDEPVAGPGEVIVRVSLAGICGTDLELARGYAGFTGIPGHELVGVVASPGDWLGRRVVAEITVACGACRECLAGRRGHCLERRVLGVRGRDGAFAERVAVPAVNLHAVPDEVSDDEAVFTEPLAAAIEVVEQVDIGTSTLVTVLGDGRLGQLAARVLALTGCRLRVVGRHPAKLAILSSLGIPAHLDDGIEPHAADVVVECTGSARGLEAARRHVHPRGTIVLKSTFAGSVDVDLAALVVDEITVVGSRCGPFGKALDLLASGRLDLTPLITARFPLEQAEAAFARAASPDALKVLLKAPPGDGA